MRVLLLNEYFPPDTSATAQMAQLVACALATRHEVVVLAGRPSYDPLSRHPPYLVRRERQGKVTVERVGSTAFHRRRMSGRLSNYLSYLALAMPAGLAIDADVVLAMTDPPLAGIAGAVVARLRGRPFVYNIRDLYPDMAVAGGIVRPGRLIDGWERLHRWALRQARRVIVLGEDMRDRVIAKGVDPERVVVVRDGAPPPASAVAASHGVTQSLRCGFRFVAMHAGNLGFYGAWDTLVRAAGVLNGEGIGIVFVGDGAEKERLRAAAQGSAAVRFLPFRPRQELPSVLSAADVHIVTIRRGLEGVVVPSKLYPILAAGRPVLAVAPTQADVARIVQEYGCGLVADPEDPRSVAAAIRRLAGDPALVRELGERAGRTAAWFDRGAQLREFVRALEAAAEGGR
ncbi:MAG: glycosyltransferase family 4 protein [Gemmatimonadetes bacterium]|nr:glycosyltransferase family 4 protein [Gemmatimonadota bacterium]